jgi:branched-chain amino acid transport system ATP-binding protein
MLEVRELKSCYGRIEVLHGMSLRIRAGETVAVIGANGAGKTTLLKVISGLQPASSGSVVVDKVALDKMPAHRRTALGIAQVPEGRQIFGGLSVEDNLRLGAWSRRKAKDDFLDDVAWIYDEFPALKDKRREPAGSLSGGQQQMLAIGRAMMSRPRLLLLDEPSMGLAPIVVDKVYETLHRLKGRGLTILLVEQNARLALDFAERGYVIETGRVLLEGGSQALLNTPAVQDAYLGT